MTHLPGTHLLVAARRWLDPATVETVFEPLVADWQQEWLGADTPRQRARVWASGWIAALSTVAQIAPAWIVAPPPGALVRVVAVRALGFCAVASALLMYPFVEWYWRNGAREAWVYLLPGVMVIPLSYVALPLGYWLRQLGDDNDHRVRRLLVQSIAVLTIVSAMTLGWIMPIANQQWRTLIFAMVSKNPHASAPVKGIRELTIPQLLSEPSQSPRYASVRREIHGRASLAISPITLGAIGWVLWQPRRRNTALVFVSWVIGGASFYQLSVFGRSIEDTYSLTPGLGFWLAQVMAVLGLVLYAMYKPSRYERRV